MQLQDGRRRTVQISQSAGNSLRFRGDGSACLCIQRIEESENPKVRESENQRIRGEKVENGAMCRIANNDDFAISRPVYSGFSSTTCPELPASASSFCHDTPRKDSAASPYRASSAYLRYPDTPSYLPTYLPTYPSRHVDSERRIINYLSGDLHATRSTSGKLRCDDSSHGPKSLQRALHISSKTQGGKASVAAAIIVGCA